MIRGKKNTAQIPREYAEPSFSDLGLGAQFLGWKRLVIFLLPLGIKLPTLHMFSFPYTPRYINQSNHHFKFDPSGMPRDYEWKLIPIRSPSALAKIWSRPAIPFFLQEGTKILPLLGKLLRQTQFERIRVSFFSLISICHQYFIKTLDFHRPTCYLQSDIDKAKTHNFFGYIYFLTQFSL